MNIRFRNRPILDGILAKGLRYDLATQQVRAMLPFQSLNPYIQITCSALQDFVESRGHILILSPKCHPELAGCGIEYSWGKTKQYFRRTANDMIASNLHSNIVKSIQLNVLPIEQIGNLKGDPVYRRM